MIARPKISRNEWKTAEIGAFEVGNFALFSCPAQDRCSRVAWRWGRTTRRGVQARQKQAPQSRQWWRRRSTLKGSAQASHFDTARSGVQSGACADIKSSTRLQCERMRSFRRRLFCRASRTRCEPSIRPKISRIDFGVTELESSEVWRGTPETGGRSPRGAARRARGARRPRARPRAGRRRGAAAGRWRRASRGPRRPTAPRRRRTCNGVIRRRFDASPPRAFQKNIFHASRALREMIARPKISRNESNNGRARSL